MYTHTHTHFHIIMHSDIPWIAPYILTHTHSLTHKFTLKKTHTHRHVSTLVLSWACLHTHIYANARIYTLSYTYTHTLHFLVDTHIHPCLKALTLIMYMNTNYLICTYMLTQSFASKLTCMKNTHAQICENARTLLYTLMSTFFGNAIHPYLHASKYAHMCKFICMLTHMLKRIHKHLHLETLARKTHSRMQTSMPMHICM